MKSLYAAEKVPRYSDAMATPTYLVGFDSLMADLPSYEAVVAWRNERGWKKCFSLSLTLSNLFLRDLPLHGPPSCGSEGRIEIHSSWWSRHSSDLISRSDRLVSVLFLFLSLPLLYFIFMFCCQFFFPSSNFISWDFIGILQFQASLLVYARKF